MTIDDANVLRTPIITKTDNKLQTQTLPATNSLSNNEVSSLSKIQIKEVHDDVSEMSVTISSVKISETQLDANDPLWVAEYSDDILKHFRSCETRYLADSNYMSKQTDVNAKMREILIDWLHEVHARFRLQPETIFLTVNILDRFLERRAVTRKRLQLLGSGAMLIASKYEEIYVPEVYDFVRMSDNAYTREQIVQMEAIILSTLEYNLTVPSPLSFLSIFSKIANFNETQKMLTHYLLQMVLQNYHFLQYIPSMIASSAVWLVMYQDGINWDSDMEILTTYSISQMRACIIDLYTMYESLNGSKYRAVQRKFMKPKCLEVAKIVLKKPTL